MKPHHFASLGDSITSSTRMRFSVHTTLRADHLAHAIVQDRAPARKIVVLVPKEGIIRDHRHDEPLFVLSMVA